MSVVPTGSCPVGTSSRLRSTFVTVTGSGVMSRAVRVGKSGKSAGAHLEDDLPQPAPIARAHLPNEAHRLVSKAHPVLVTWGVVLSPPRETAF